MLLLLRNLRILHITDQPLPGVLASFSRCAKLIRLQRDGPLHLLQLLGLGGLLLLQRLSVGAIVGFREAHARCGVLHLQLSAVELLLHLCQFCL